LPPPIASTPPADHHRTPLICTLSLHGRSSDLSLSTTIGSTRRPSAGTSAAPTRVNTSQNPVAAGASNGTPIAGARAALSSMPIRSEEHTSELQSRENLVCRLLLEKKKNKQTRM